MWLPQLATQRWAIHSALVCTTSTILVHIQETWWCYRWQYCSLVSSSVWNSWWHDQLHIHHTYTNKTIRVTTRIKPVKNAMVASIGCNNTIDSIDTRICATWYTLHYWVHLYELLLVIDQHLNIFNWVNGHMHWTAIVSVNTTDWLIILLVTSVITAPLQLHNKYK